MSSKSIQLQTKQSILEILLVRCLDVSAYYTRSKVLQVLRNYFDNIMFNLHAK